MEFKKVEDIAKGNFNFLKKKWENYHSINS